MAVFNKVILVGRLTRDPESRTFGNGGKVCKIGFAVTNRRKNAQTGQWEDEPMFIDADVFNRGEYGKLADLVEERCRKGSQILIEGKLHLDQWDDKTTGQKRSKHKIVIEAVQLLDPRPNDGGEGGSYGGGRSNDDYSSSDSFSRGGGGGNAPARSGSGYSPPPARGNDSFDDDSGFDEPNGGDIPF